MKDELPGTHKLTSSEQLAVFKELQRNPKLDVTKLARYFNTSEKEVKRAVQKGAILRWK